MNVYMIYSNKGDKVYIGSTTKSLNDRYSRHKQSFRKGITNCSSIILFDEYGIDNCFIKLLKRLETDDIQTGRAYEQLYINKYSNRCVNIHPAIAFLYFRNENREYLKKWYKEHKEKHKEVYKERFRKWYEENREYNIERARKYKEEHKEEISERRRKYYEEHKEEIKVKVICSLCGRLSRQKELKLHQSRQICKDNRQLYHQELDYIRQVLIRFKLIK